MKDSPSHLAIRTLVIAMSVLTVQAAHAVVPLLDDVQAMFEQHGGLQRRSSLQTVQEIRAEDEAGLPIPGWRYGSLIGGLQQESERDAVGNPDQALRKIDLALRLAMRWRPRLDRWSTTILVNEGQLLMTRWFLVGKNEDLALARKKFEQADIDESDADSKGQGAYFLGASYEKLARWAGDIERPRDAQIALIRAGIEANKAGRARYPFDSTIGLNALYRSLEMVTERSALAPYVDEWVDYMKSQSEESQMIAAPYLADALFQQGRDVEGLAWMERYAKHAERADVSPDDEPRVLSLRCRDISPLLNQGVAQYARRDPANFEKLGNRVCKGEFADRLMGRSPASASQKP